MLITLAVVIIVPVAWVFLASIKQNSEFYGNPWALPAGFYWQNFVDAWNAASMSAMPLATMAFTNRKAILMVEMMKKVRVVRMLVQMRGRVIWKNWAMRPAPSRLADS